MPGSIVALDYFGFNRVRCAFHQFWQPQRSNDVGLAGELRIVCLLLFLNTFNGAQVPTRLTLRGVWYSE
jgi:hypothetical protein